jgi:hypothetical protein
VILAAGARRSLSRADFVQINRLIEEGQPDQALAHLARAIRNDRAHLAAAARICSICTQEDLPLPIFETRHEGGATAARSAADGQRFLTGEGTVRHACGTSPAVLCSRASPARRAGLDDRVQPRGTPRAHNPLGFPMHDGPIFDARFDPQGHKVATASGDGFAKVWSARRGESIVRPIQHSSGASLVRFGADGEKLLTASNDGIARVWKLPRAEPATDELKYMRRCPLRPALEQQAQGLPPSMA